MCKPTNADKLFFLFGLSIYAVGQLVISILQGALQSQKPIDYAHWLLLIGVFLLIPFSAKLPRHGLHRITSPVLLAGIVCVIGMCMLDFVFWAIPSPELKSEVAGHLIAADSIWQPFMKIGPNRIFMLGLALPSLAYYRASMLGTAFVIIGVGVVVLTPQWVNALGYSVIIIGYFLNFEILRSRSEYLRNDIVQ